MDSNQIEQSLYQLIAIAEENQKAVKAALDGLSKEREAIPKTIQSAVEQSVAANIKTSLKGSSEAIAHASGQLTNASQWFSLGILGTCAGALLLIALIGFGFVEWKKSEVQELADRKALLEQELPILEARAAEWEQKAGRAVLTQCGPKKKPCVRVNPSAGTFGTKDEVFYILDGS
jgi:hypothetical protein